MCAIIRAMYSKQWPNESTTFKYPDGTTEDVHSLLNVIKLFEEHYITRSTDTDVLITHLSMDTSLNSTITKFFMCKDLLNSSADFDGFKECLSFLCQQATDDEGRFEPPHPRILRRLQDLEQLIREKSPLYNDTLFDGTWDLADVYKTKIKRHV